MKRNWLGVFLVMSTLLLVGCNNRIQPSLLEACIKGESKIVEKMIARGTNVNEAGYLNNCLINKSMPENPRFAFYYAYGGVTPLMAASMGGNGEIIRVLLKAGANVNAVSKGNGTALMAASYQGFDEIVKDLIGAGANVNEATYDGWTALMSASSGGKADIVKILLDAGAKVNISNENGKTALFVASYKGHTDVVRALLARGADVNAKEFGYWTAVAEASKYGRTDTVKALVEAGADVNISQPQTGWNALLAASKSGYTDIVKILLAAGANVNAVSSIGLAREKQYKGEKVTFVPQASNTSSLMQASYAGHIEIVKLLIAANADVNKINALGETALSVAKTEEIKELLKQAGAQK